uniref:Uncharacterized protein n=1 Tax=Kalanchoe fedtschenkoi TaxID=63787 RepID=A0A7N0UFT7_KALFE
MLYFLYIPFKSTSRSFSPGSVIARIAVDPGKSLSLAAPDDLEQLLAERICQASISEGTIRQRAIRAPRQRPSDDEQRRAWVG